MNKKILLVLVAVLALVFVFTGCESYDFGPVAGDDYSKELVIGNGGVAVQQGNYLYFVNGSAGIAADNTFGKVVKGAIMRYKVDSNGALVGEPVTIVPKAAYGTSTVSGIYVYGEWIYYASPSTATDSEGNVQTDDIVFFRTKTNGTDTEKLLTLKGLSTEYAFSENALIYVTTNLSSSSASTYTITSVDYETKESSVITDKATAYVIPRETKFDAKSTKVNADGYVYYTKASEELSDFNNEVWVAKMDNSYNAKMIGKYSYFADAEKDKYEANDFSIGTPDYNKIFTIVPVKYANGVLYYAKYISENGSSVNKGVYSYDVENYLNTTKKFDGSLETTWSTLTTYSTLYPTDNKETLIVATTSKMYILTPGEGVVAGVFAEEIFPTVKTVLAVKDGYMFYYTSTSNDIYKIKITTEGEEKENAVKITNVTPNSTWRIMEMTGDFIYYVHPDYNYVYRINTALEKTDDNYDVMLGKYNEADQKLVDKANENN